MRPNSIVQFERLFLGSIALSVVNFVLGYGAMTRAIEREPTLATVGVGSGAATGLFAIGIAIYLLLWFLIARKAVGLAKWVLVVLFALSLLSLLTSLANGGFAANVTALLGLVVYALELAAISFLFRADAVAWFRGEPPADSAASA